MTSDGRYTASVALSCSDTAWKVLTTGSDTQSFVYFLIPAVPGRSIPVLQMSKLLPKWNAPRSKARTGHGWDLDPSPLAGRGPAPWLADRDGSRPEVCRQVNLITHRTAPHLARRRRSEQRKFCWGQERERRGKKCSEVLVWVGRNGGGVRPALPFLLFAGPAVSWGVGRRLPQTSGQGKLPQILEFYSFFSQQIIKWLLCTVKPWDTAVNKQGVGL